MSLSDQTRTLLESVAALPPGDEVREAAHRRALAEAPGEAVAVIAALDAEARALGAALRGVPAPAGLAARLLAVPAETVPLNGHPAAQDAPRPGGAPPARRPATASKAWWRRRVTWATAAGLLIAAGAWYAAGAVMDARDRGRLHALADAAVRLHTAPPAMTVQGETPARTLKLLRDAAPAFPVAVLPALGRDARLLGGGMTSLDGAPVAFTRWEKCGRVYTLLQFMPNQEGLRAEFPQTVEESPTRSPAGKPYAVAFWPNTMMGCGWALVMEDRNAPWPVRKDTLY